MSNNMKPRMLNRICAHPIIIACTLGACTSNALLFRLLLDEAPLQAIVSDWQTIFYILAIFIPAATLLGCILGMFVFWPLTGHICRRINGAPLKSGDQVVVLSGLHKGTVTEVYEIIVGREGWEVARLDLGVEHKERFRDVFQEYSVLKIKKSKQ